MGEHVADLPLSLLRRATRSTRHLFRRAIQEDANRAIQEDASIVRASVIAIGWAMSVTCSLVAGHGALYTGDCSGALHTDANTRSFMPYRRCPSLVSPSEPGA